MQSSSCLLLPTLLQSQHYSALKMSSNELIVELLAMTSGLESFNTFQILNIAQSNSLFSFAPQLIEFEQSCGGELQQLLELSQSSIFNEILETNLNLAGSLSPCLAQLVWLEQLFTSGRDNVQLSNSNSNNDVNNNNNVNNSNNTQVNNSNSSNSSDSSNSTGSVSNSTASNDSAAANSTAVVSNSKKSKNKNRKRGEVVQRSGASKKQVLGSFGLGLMVIVGTFAL
ncbi:hypothetical protein NA56DRAFT_189211 [Hyaloscypha hepaticicola]|uniref:Uncharacterized protein n=1 Tax=Hyaloscypha hepaticicola TaxID=2082293 RepID=A0A2J6Q0Y3_9HELO|nr:hypothetical protein NA56DRAFT_189211 [Hyaloscypha hepaticicola]